MATDFTRGWSLEAIKTIFDNLKASYDGDMEARKRMHDAATNKLLFVNTFTFIAVFHQNTDLVN